MNTHARTVAGWESLLWPTCSVDLEACVDWYRLVLFLTWLVVVPYLVLFPPQIRFIRRRLQARRERHLLKACSMQDKWEVKQRSPKLVASSSGPSCRDPSLDTRLTPSRSSDSIVSNGSGIEASGLRRWIIPRHAPVIVALVNRKSGGQLGAATLRCLTSLLHPGQVFDLAEVPSIAAILRSITGNFKLLICGGDGTVSWAMDVATLCGIRPPMAILPLGTGNDLSRSLGWGSGFGMGDVTEDAVRGVLVNMHANSATQALDRWELVITPKPAPDTPTGTDGQLSTCIPTVIRKRMINYFSCGVDAEISLKFHRERLDYPERFSSQTKNVVKYAMLGFQASFDGRPLNGTVRAFADGQELQMMDGWKGAIVSNSPYYHGGKDFWGTPEGPDDTFGPSRIDDGKLEVMALAGTFHIGLCNINVDSALRVGQGRSIEIELMDDCAVQIDGESFPQPPCTITFNKSDQYPMLRRKTAA
jgi:diacylglycerol kinase (ATP)